MALIATALTPLSMSPPDQRITNSERSGRWPEWKDVLIEIGSGAGVATAIGPKLPLPAKEIVSVPG